MKYKVYSKLTHVGDCDLEIIDDSMGIAKGQFIPSENYYLIEPTILHLMDIMGYTGEQGSDKEVSMAYEKRDNLELKVNDIGGYSFNPLTVHIEDLRKEFPEEGISLELIGFSQEDREQLRKEM